MLLLKIQGIRKKVKKKTLNTKNLKHLTICIILAAIFPYMFLHM